MPTKAFIGRKTELSNLKQLENKRTSSLIVVKGRRRIGKSRLIKELAQGAAFYSFEGIAPSPETTKQDQLDEFSRQMSRSLGGPYVIFDDWSNAFWHLAQQCTTGRVIILLDEISWMGSKDPNFLGKLKIAWDNHFKTNPKLFLIICGSATAWIERNILASTGFMGRVSYTLTLEELPLNDCNKFWNENGSQFSAYDKFKILSITGGIPRYLEEIQFQLPAEKNIRNLCFKKGGILVNEFNNIFSDLFGSRSEKYTEIVKLLVQGSLEYCEICEKLGVEKSGLISAYLTDLVMSGFISRDHTWDPKTGIAAPLLFKYRLQDNYLRFYLKYIENRLPEIEKNVYQFKTISSLPGWDSIMGLQFENLVLNNRHFIHEQLEISPYEIITANPFFQHKTTRRKGCQIDYMIQTRNKVLYACEIKFSNDQIPKSIIKEMQEKMAALSLPRGMSYCPVLIHVNGIHESVRDSDYFHAIIDFSETLKD